MASVSSASPPPGGKGGGKKILGMPAPVVIAGGIALVLGVGWVLISRRRATAQAAQATGATAKVGAGIDWSGPVSTLQAEIIDLQGEVAQINREETQDEKTDKQLKGELAQDAKEDKREDNDKDDKRKPKHRCPPGFHFMPVPDNSDLWPVGGRRVQGGFCVPDRHKKHHHHRQPAAA